MFKISLSHKNVGKAGGDLQGTQNVAKRLEKVLKPSLDTTQNRQSEKAPYPCRNYLGHHNWSISLQLSKFIQVDYENVNGLSKFTILYAKLFSILLLNVESLK